MDAYVLLVCLSVYRNGDLSLGRCEASLHLHGPLRPRAAPFDGVYYDASCQSPRSRARMAFQWGRFAADQNELKLSLVLGSGGLEPGRRDSSHFGFSPQADP